MNRDVAKIVLLHDDRTLAHVNRVRAIALATADNLDSHVIGDLALMHDAVEDGIATLQEAHDALGDDFTTTDALAYLTRDKLDGAYDDYIARIANCPRPTVRRRAITVKLADLTDHLSPRNAMTITKSKARRYRRAQRVLYKALTGIDLDG